MLPDELHIELKPAYNPDTEQVICSYRLANSKLLNWLFTLLFPG